MNKQILETLLSELNKVNGTDFELVNPNSKYLASQNPYLYSEKHDMIIGYDGELYVATKEGFNVGVFSTQREVINFVSLIKK